MRRKYYGFEYAVDFDPPSKRSKTPLPPALLVAQAAKFVSMPICEDIAKEIVDKAATKVRDKLLNAMRPAYVRKQILITTRDSVLFNNLRHDKDEVAHDKPSDADEPVAAKADVFQQGQLKVIVREPEPLFKMQEYGSLSSKFGSDSGRRRKSRIGSAKSL